MVGMREPLHYGSYAWKHRQQVDGAGNGTR
jgi:hypothetical protein